MSISPFLLQYDSEALRDCNVPPLIKSCSTASIAVLTYPSKNDEVKLNGRSAFTAAKYLIEEPWKDKRNPKVKEQNKKTTEAAKSVFSEDLERLQEFMN